MKLIKRFKYFYLYLFFSFLIPQLVFSQNNSSYTSTGNSSSFIDQKKTVINNQTSSTSSNQEVQINEDTTTENKLDNTIDVGAPGVKKIRIAIPNFVIQDKTISLSTKDANALSKRMENILDFTNWFEFIPQDAFNSQTNLVLQPFQAAQWKAIKADYVVFGKFTTAKNTNRFNIELRLFDVKSQNQLIGKLYANVTAKTADIALRRFGDVLVGALTGTPGPFMSQIVFVGKKQVNSNGQIYIADFDGGNMKQITNNNAVNLSPTWTKEGTKITYTSFKSGRPEIYTYNLITKQEKKEVGKMQNSSGASWTPDGNTIAFSSSTKDGATHIFSINRFGGNKKTLVATSTIEVEPAFSPDGKSLAYTSTKFGKPMIFVKNLATDNTTRITYAGWYNASASWSPDSKTIAFASFDRDIDRWDLFKISANGSNLERLTLNQGDNEKPTWSPDGRFILFQSDRTSKGTRFGQRKIYVMTKDGAYQKALNIPLPEVKQPSWGPRMLQFDDE